MLPRRSPGVTVVPSFLPRGLLLEVMVGGVFVVICGWWVDAMLTVFHFLSSLFHFLAEFAKLQVLLFERVLMDEVGECAVLCLTI